MRQALWCAVVLTFSGCAAMQAVDVGLNMADEVKNGKDVVHKGIVDSVVAKDAKTSVVRLQDGAEYTVTGFASYSRGTVVRILKKGDQYTVSTNTFDSEVVASGRVTRVDHRASGSVVVFDNGSTYEVVGDPALTIGQRAVIEKKADGYHARQDSF